MSKENGFAPIRRGLWEHIRDGRMSHLQALAFVYICSQADTRTGIWKGCAKSLAAELGLRERTARDVLEKMERGDYIRRFAVPGLHSCYPILVHKFAVTQGEHNGEQLNALTSKSPAELAYFSCEQIVEHGGEHSAGQRRIENREKRRKADKPPADARFGAFLEFAKASFQTKHKHPPTWDYFAKDGSALAAFLRRAAHVTLEDWQAHVLNFFDSTEAFTVKQGGSLAYFISRFDTFSAGPILEGGSNGKVTSFSDQNAEAKKPPQQSARFWAVLRKHLAIFTEHYRQPMNKLSVLAYAEDLSDLTPDQLDRACIEARRTSEFMPVSATIRNCLSRIRSSEPVYLGPPLLEYPQIVAEERQEALVFSEELRKKLGPLSKKDERPRITVRPSTLSIEEQRQILQEKGFL
jgi:hypothetical protein